MSESKDFLPLEKPELKRQEAVTMQPNYNYEENRTWNLMQLCRVKKLEYLQVVDGVIVSFLDYNYCKDIESDKFDNNWSEVRDCLEELYTVEDYKHSIDLKLYKKSRKGLQRLKSIYKKKDCIDFLDNLINRKHCHLSL